MPFVAVLVTVRTSAGRKLRLTKPQAEEKQNQANDLGLLTADAPPPVTSSLDDPPIFADVILNDQFVVPAFLDSGASRSFISTILCDKFGIPYNSNADTIMLEGKSTLYTLGLRHVHRQSWFALRAHQILCCASLGAC